MAAKTASLSVNIIADAAKAKAGLREAETAFGKFRNSVDGATGTMGKFKAGSGAALDFVKSNALTFASAAGAAIGAFAVKSVNAFQDLALSAGKFADATGLAVEDASKLIEVAGDIGIEATSVEKSIGFMNKTLGNSPKLFKDLGIQIEYTNGGATDVSGTFLNVVDRLQKIKDPAERAAAATKLLGRGWTDMSELIMGGSDALAKSMSQVSEQKVISEEELKKAREYRAAMDNLNDRFEDISLTVGSKLAPAFANAVDDVLSFVDAAKEIPGISKAFSLLLNPGVDEEGRSATLAGLVSRLFDLGEETKEVNVVTDQMARVWKEGKQAMIDAHKPTQNLTTYLEEQQVALDRVKGALDRLKGSLNLKLSMMDAKAEIDGFTKKWSEAMTNGQVNADEFTRDLIGIQLMLIQLRQDLGITATAFLNNEFRIFVDTGQLERAWQLLQAIAKGGEMRPPTGPGSGDQALMTPIKPRSPAPSPAPKPPAPAPKAPPRPANPRQGDLVLRGLASGGTLTSSGLVLVGEDGPELLGLPRGASVTPNIPQRLNDAAGGTTVINISVQAGLVSSPDQVGQQIIEAIRRAERRSGQVFVNA